MIEYGKIECPHCNTVICEMYNGIIFGEQGALGRPLLTPCHHCREDFVLQINAVFTADVRKVERRKQDV